MLSSIYKTKEVIVRNTVTVAIKIKGKVIRIGIAIAVVVMMMTYIQEIGQEEVEEKIEVEEEKAKVGVGVGVMVEEMVVGAEAEMVVGAEVVEEGGVAVQVVGEAFEGEEAGAEVEVEMFAILSLAIKHPFEFQLDCGHLRIFVI